MSEDWTPEAEKENDPSRLIKESVELQKKQIEMARKFLEKGEEAEKNLLTKGEEAEKAPDSLLSDSVLVGSYRPPSFSETSAKCEKVWLETKRIAGDAPESVQGLMFHSLVNTPEEDDPS